jgi:hypothetical protein
VSEKAPRQPMTDGEREILFQIQQMQAKWVDTLQMVLYREVNHRQRIEELAQNIRELTEEVQEPKQREAMEGLRQEVQHSAAQGQRAILSQMVEFRDECLTAIAQCQAELLRQVRQTMGFTKAVSDLTQQVKELREQLTKDKLF